MLLQEIKTIEDKEYQYTYSDSGFFIRQVETGHLYNDAMDLIPCLYSYVETDELIDPSPNPLSQQQTINNDK